MARIPKKIIIDDKAETYNIYNAIRSATSSTFKENMPKANASLESCHEIGSLLINYSDLRNEFIDTLYNRIAFEIVTSKMFYNPLAMFKYGMLDNGETVEEIFINLAKPFKFDPEAAGSKWMKREKPDVRTAFHSINYKVFYKVTTTFEELKTAFLSWSGVYDFISKIIESLYRASNYDDFNSTKYLLARCILNGYIQTVEIPEANKANSEDITIAIKSTSNAMRFDNDHYDMARVLNHSDYDEQYIMVSAKYDAIADVAVLASAFNMDKAEFIGHKIVIDSFGSIDLDRLKLLLGSDYVDITKEQLTALDNLPAVIVDKKFFMIFDALNTLEEDHNGEGLYWQRWLHVWRTYSISPFAPAALFVPGKPTVTRVSVSPKTASMGKGTMLQLTAEVITNNFAPKDIVWTTSSKVSYITNNGMLEISPDETESTITVTATSVFDDTKSDTATITIQ